MLTMALSETDISELKAITNRLCEIGKGILSVDEGTFQAAKKLSDVGLDANQTSRRDYLELLLTAPGLQDYISGAILSEETIGLKTKDDTLFTDALLRQGVMTGIRVDQGMVELPGLPNDVFTIGLDLLSRRLADYKKKSADFASWKTRFAIGSEVPSKVAIEANCHLLGIYALLSQQAGLVPMLDIRVSQSGNHDLEESQKVHATILRMLFKTLSDYKVLLSCILLRITMVTPGASCDTKASADDIAKSTLEAMNAIIEADLPEPNEGDWRANIFFSDHTSDKQAAERLNRMYSIPHLYRLGISFCFDEFIEKDARELWARNKTANFSEAQKLVIARAKESHLATLGEWKAQS